MFEMLMLAKGCCLTLAIQLLTKYHTHETRQDGAESLLTCSSRITDANENKIVTIIGTINLTDEPLTVGAVDVVAALSADS